MDDKGDNVLTFGSALALTKNGEESFKDDLKEATFEMDCTDENDKILLIHMAEIQNNPSDISWILLEYMSDPNCKDKDGNTALHYAFKNNNKPMIIVLLMFGANPDIANEQSLKPYEMNNIKKDEHDALIEKINKYKFNFLQLGKKTRKKLKKVFDDIDNDGLKTINDYKLKL